MTVETELPYRSLMPGQTPPLTAIGGRNTVVMMAKL